MLPGSNTLELNMATMIEIVQYYLMNKVFRDYDCPKVLSIECGLDKHSEIIKVKLEGKFDEPTK